MKTKRRQRIILVFSIILASMIFDQASKIIVRNNMTNNDTISFVKNSIAIIKAENTGAALGLGGNLPSMLKTIYFQIVPIAVLFFFLRKLVTKIEISKLSAVGLSLSIGGAIANIFDRVFYGSVTDFIQLNVGTMKTGIFNIADIFIVFGTIIVVFELIYNKKNNLLEII